MLNHNATLALLFFAYLGAVISVGWLIVRPDTRRRCLDRIEWHRRKLSTATDRLASRCGDQLSIGRRSCSGRIRGGINYLSARKWHLGVTVAILLLPLIFTTMLRSPRSLAGYDDIAPTEDPVIKALLYGERLVPPPPLPPEAFVTREVEAVRQALSGASREWNLLDPDFRQRLLTVFRLMELKGYQMVLLEGYRSPERQSFLANLGPHVTNAGAFQSYHQFGLAADCAFFRNGKIVISERDPWAMEGYRLYGQLAESVGLTWGGRWKMMDFGHVELRRPGTLGSK